METQLLRDQEAYPSEELLKEVLSTSFPAYSSLMKIVSDSESGLTAEWKYYKDGKAWLCKVTHRKKTVFWLSVWKDWVQVGFYFTEKHLEGIASLDIDETIKEEFYRQKPIGRHLPMVFRISSEEQLVDLLKVIHFKKTLK